MIILWIIFVKQEWNVCKFDTLLFKNQVCSPVSYMNIIMTAKPQTDLHPIINVRKDTRLKNFEVNSENWGKTA